MLNTLDENLKFTIEIAGSSISFLDLKFFIEGNRLESTVYSKPIDSHVYLEASSCRKKSSKTGIIKSVTLRLCRICSTMENFKIKSSEYLVARGTSAKLVKSEFDCLLYQDMIHVKM